MVTGSGAAGSIGHELLRTTDGGATWKRIEYNYIGQRSPHAIGACDFVANVTFSSAMDGWATGICGAAPQIHAVYRTTNGGRTWFVKSLPVRPGWTNNRTATPCSQAYLQSFPPSFAGSGAPRVGVLPVAMNRPSEFVLYRTTNGGAGWRKTKPIKGHMSCAPQAVEAALDPSHIWALLNGTLYSTSDSGRHWTALTHHPGMGLSSKLQFVSISDGFALRGAHPGFISATLDGGRTWHRIQTNL
jgi:photosystem II stability/assembly factor-like uncharacterized protein